MENSNEKQNEEIKVSLVNFLLIGMGSLALIALLVNIIYKFAN